jgi:uncharacterized cupredoxin-like copper-binding protein
MSGTFTPESPQENGVATPKAPDPAPLTDQQRFDATVDRDGKIALQILAGVAIFAALVMSTVALALSGGKTEATKTVTLPAVAAAAVPAVPPLVSLSVAGGNKRGPDGKLHDSFSKTNFAVKVGQPTQLRIDNKDESPHTITSPQTGVAIVIMPGVHTYTINATTAGRFEWICIIPCDSDAKGWAMTHPGYMAGYITAT